MGDVVAVVAAQQDVGVLTGLDPLGQRLQGALNTDVDDLLVVASGPGQRHGAVVHGQQGLDEAHGHMAAGGVEEEQGAGLVPLTLGGVGGGQFVAVCEDPVPAGPLLRFGTPPQHAHAEGGVNVLAIDEKISRYAHGAHATGHGVQ